MSRLGRPRKSDEDKANPYDKLECPLCGETFLRSNQTRHRKSKLHKLAEQLTSSQKKHGGFNDTNEYKPKKLSNKEIKKRLKNLDSDNESESDNSDEEIQIKKPIYKKRLVSQRKMINIPQELHDYVLENYGTIRLNPDKLIEAEEYFNNPYISFHEKTQTLDDIARMQRKNE